MSGGLRHRNDERKRPEPCSWINKSSKSNSVRIPLFAVVCPDLQKARHPILDRAGVVRDVENRVESRTGAGTVASRWACDSAPAIIVSGPAQRSLTLWPARSPSRLTTLSIESSGSFVASAAVSIATGWNGPVPGRELHPLKSSAFHGALFHQLPQRRTFPGEGHNCVIFKTEKSEAVELLQQWRQLTPP